MRIAHLCLLLAALLPILFTAIAKIIARRQFNNYKPRDFQAKLSGVALRAHWAQLNSFEAFPPFAVAVLVAEHVGAAQGRIDALALAFIGFRVIYGGCYLANWAALRSLVWFAGMGCVVWLFVLGL